IIWAGKRLKEEKFEFKMLIIGDGPEYNNLLTKIKEYNLEQQIKLVGYDSNPYKYITRSDFVICSSKFEAYSTVITEALILATPVITTECSGMQELIGETNAGIITENSRNDLYLGLKKILNNQEL